MTPSWASVADAEAMAGAHALCFDAPWSPAAFAELLASPGVFGALAAEEGAPALILCRVAAGEMEVLTIGVAAQARRRGLACALMAAAIAAGREAGATDVFLEVAADNAAAIGLYERLRFMRSGVRKGYYRRGAEASVDAVAMHLDLRGVSP